MKTIVAILAICLLAVPVANAQLGLIQGAFERVTFAQEFGVGVPMSDDIFQTDYKESIVAAPRIELFLGKGISIYTKYTFETFDVVAGADSLVEPIDASTWAYGAMVQGGLNATGSVVAYLELGLQKSISVTEPDEWQFWQGLAARFYLTPSERTAIDLGVRYKPLGDAPTVEEFLPRVAFCVAPGK